MAKIYASNSTAIASEQKIAIYRYWIDTAKGAIPLLSSVTPDTENLSIMRYRPDPVIGNEPLGYIARSDSNLDGNSRWVKDASQTLCYGIKEFSGNCPTIAKQAIWSLKNALTGETILTKKESSLGKVMWTAAEIQVLMQRIRTNRLALLTLEVDGALIAVKGIRTIRLPFVSQYDNNTESGIFTSDPSANLIANQMTSHPQLTHPYADRLIDPALYDGIVSHTFYDANVFLQKSSLDSVKQLQRDAFGKLDRNGTLVIAEIVTSFANKLGLIYPFNPFQAKPCTGTNSEFDRYAGESFDPNTGKFVLQDCTQQRFFVDYASTDAIAWMRTGVKPYIESLRSIGVHLAGISFSEVAIQVGNPSDPDHSNNTRLPYYNSPTFSEKAFLAFRTWLRTVAAHPSFVALPILPEHYQKALASGNSAIYRVQPTDPKSELWNYWSIWRRDIFNRMVATLANDLKAEHNAMAYTRTPLAVYYYDYPEWNIIGNQQFNWKGFAGSNYFNHGVRYEGGTSLRVSPGVDFEIAHQISQSAFDYFVHEVKYFEDAWTNAEIDRILAFRNRQTIKPKIGLHVEVDEPNPNSNYINTHFAKVYPIPDDYANPAFDLIWTWESQCKYIMSQKAPDPGNNEIFFGTNGANGFTVTNWGSYKSIYDSHKKTVGNFCLERYWLSLGKNCDGTSCIDYKPLKVTHENFRRLMNWRRASLN